MSDAPLRRHGVADTKEIAETEGRQIFQTMIDGMLPGRRWRKLSLSNFVKVGDGVAAFQGGPDEAFLNPMGGPRPRGWALTPVDSVAHCAATTLLPVGTGDTTIETKVNFSHPQGILGGSTRSRGLYRKALAYFRPRVQSSTRKAACSRTEPP